MTEPMQKTILVSGGSGLIGTSLLRSFSRDRIQTIRLVREKSDRPESILWNPDAPELLDDLTRLENADAAIHLSGASLSSRRWTDSYKREIVESRVRTTRALVDLLKRLQNPPRSLLCASAVGIYGDRGDEVLTENSSPGRGFLADTCRAWEAEAERAAEAGLRVVHLRFGVVLSREGGALKQMLPVFRAGFGGRLGSGRQWMSWIAINDLVRAVLHILETDSLHGGANLVAPGPVTNAEFTRALGRALRRPAVLPVPPFALRVAVGEIADAALLASTRAIPERLTASGFRFDFPEITGALRSIL
ncbi:MAG: TIGR01777 family oxidoreductase [Silvibacterium sp.]